MKRKSLTLMHTDKMNQAATDFGETSQGTSGSPAEAPRHASSPGTRNRRKVHLKGPHTACIVKHVVMKYIAGPPTAVAAAAGGRYRPGWGDRRWELGRQRWRVLRSLAVRVG